MMRIIKTTLGAVGRRHLKQIERMTSTWQVKGAGEGNSREARC